MFRTCHSKRISHSVSHQFSSTHWCPWIIHKPMSHRRPSSGISQFLDMSSAQRERNYRSASRDLDVIFKFLLLLLWSICSLPGHGLRFSAHHGKVVKIEDKGPLLPLVFFECPASHMCLVMLVKNVLHGT